MPDRWRTAVSGWVTVGGRAFTLFALFLELGIVAVPTDLLVAALSKVRAEEEAGEFCRK